MEYDHTDLSEENYLNTVINGYTPWLELSRKPTGILDTLFRVDV